MQALGASRASDDPDQRDTATGIHSCRVYGSRVANHELVVSSTELPRGHSTPQLDSEICVQKLETSRTRFGAGSEADVEGT